MDLMCDRKGDLVGYAQFIFSMKITLSTVSSRDWGGERNGGFRIAGAAKPPSGAAKIPWIAATFALEVRRGFHGRPICRETCDFSDSHF